MIETKISFPAPRRDVYTIYSERRNRFAKVEITNFTDPNPRITESKAPSVNRLGATSGRPFVGSAQQIVHYRLNDRIRALRGKADAWDLKNVSFGAEGAFLNGAYEHGKDPDGFRASLRVKGLANETMTVALQFKLNSAREAECLLVGGRSSRWFALPISKRQLSLTFNNGRQRFSLEGIEMGSGVWNRIAVSIDVPNRVVAVWLNGKRAKEVVLPSTFSIEAVPGDTDLDELTFTDYSRGVTFSGWVKEIAVYNRAFGWEELSRVGAQISAVP